MNAWCRQMVEGAAELGVEAGVDLPLGERTTYRVGGHGAVVLRPVGTSQITALVPLLAGREVVVLGQGSNSLVADAGFDGVALVVGGHDASAAAESALRIVPESDAAATMIVEAAARLPVVARRTVALGWCGAEWMVGVPGSVGGAICMNAGGHGSDIEQMLARAEILDLRRGRIAWVAAEALGFRFRGSALTTHHVVLSAEFTLGSPGIGHEGTCAEVLSEIVAWRRENQPGGQNAGSVFVNPGTGERSAGALIDACGLRGARVGTASVSTKHANFIQSEPGGCADDVVAVMELVQTVVEARHGVVLRSEVKLVGYPEDVVRRFAVHGDYGIDDASLAAATARLDSLI